MAKLHYEGRMSMRSGILRLIFGGLCALSALASLPASDAAARQGAWTLLLMGAALVGTVAVQCSSTYYKVTSERVTQHRGLIARNTSEVELSDIRNIQVNQGAIARILDIGNVAISSAGQSGMEVVFRGIRDPGGVAEIVRRARKRVSA